MNIYFKNLHGVEITNYTTLLPCFPVLLHLHDVQPHDTINGTVKIGNTTMYTISKQDNYAQEYTLASGFDNYYYYFTPTGSQNFTVTASLRVTGSSSGTLTASLSVRYVHPFDCPTHDRIFNAYAAQSTKASDAGEKMITDNNYYNLRTVTTTGRVIEDFSGVPVTEGDDSTTSLETTNWLLPANTTVLKNYETVNGKRTSGYTHPYDDLKKMFGDILVRCQYPYIYSDITQTRVRDKIFPCYDQEIAKTVVPIENVMTNMVNYNNEPLELDSFENDTDLAAKPKEITFTEKYLQYSRLVGINTSVKLQSINRTYKTLAIFKNPVNEQLCKAAIYYDIRETPPLVAVGAAYEIEQWSSISLDKVKDIMKNDYGKNKQFSRVIPGSVIGGTTTSNDTSSYVGFTSTKIYTEVNPCGFKYEITNSDGFKSVGDLTITVTRLSDIEGYAFLTDAEAAAFMATYRPPTMKDVFDKWSRISGAILDYGSPRQLEETGKVVWRGENNQWKEIEGGFYCTVNSSNLVGFISPKSYESYTHECTVSSTHGDNDYIGLVLAYYRDPSNNQNKTFVIFRQLNPGNGRDVCGFQAKVYHNNTVKNTFTPDIMTDVNKNRISDTKNDTWGCSSCGWRVRGNTRIYANRDKNIYTLKCTSFLWNGTDDYYETSNFIVDASAYDSLKGWADTLRLPYGYCCHSQLNSRFTNQEFHGSLREDIIFTRSGKIWKYYNDREAWALSDETIQDVFGYPRYVINPNNSGIFEVLKDRIVTIQEPTGDPYEFLNDGITY